MILPDSLVFGIARVVHRFNLTPHLQVNHIDVAIPGLDSQCEGMLIAHVSDVHVGEGAWEPCRLGDAAAAIQDARPDVVVNTGDFLQGEPPLDKVVERVSCLKDAAPDAPHYAILGNHDYYAVGLVQELQRKLVGLGINSLTNRVCRYERQGGFIFFAGLSEEDENFEGGVQSLLASPRPRILLTHQIEVLERLPRGAADLVLAGHTHGGQIGLGPLTPLIVRRFNGSKYVEGRYTVNGMSAYINRGLGNTGVPIRWNARPEVTIIRLTR
ncbi:MAG: metallophosphoesterase [Chloroflexota bacterium]